MWQGRSKRYLLGSLAILFALQLVSTAQRKKDKNDHKELLGTAILWQEPTAVSAQNLLLGAGGEAMRPDLSRVTFLEKKEGGYSTKYRVRDAAGNEWIAKIGKEAQPETSANRILWAIGYETEIVYLVPHLTIEGKGTFDNVRLEARPKNIKRSGNWRWDDNPFVGKPEFQALKIMMLMINNWDMKDTNNQILIPKDSTDPKLIYIISDLGGTFGKTGGAISRSRNKPSDYVKANFIEKIKGDVIDFNYRGKNKKLFDDITVANARWLSVLLGRLSDEQIKDAFRAANYSPDEVDKLAAAFRSRMNDLASVTK